MSRGKSRAQRARATKTRRPDLSQADSTAKDSKPGTKADAGERTGLGDEWLRDPHITVPEPKQQISFRVDPDVLDFFKSQGPRYQTRMNAVLRAYMTAHAEEEG